MRVKELDQVKFEIEAKEFYDKFYNKLVSEINLAFKNLTLGDNIKGSIVRVDGLESGKSTLISHKLKKTPSYRIILRQIGNAVITDGTTWDNKKIELINNGPDTVSFTVIIM